MIRAGACWLVIVAAVVLPVFAADSPLEQLLDAGHFKRARAIAEQRLAANANDAEALYAMSRVKVEYGDLEGALTLAEKAVALDERNANYHYMAGGIYGQMAEKASIFKQMGLARRFKKEAEQAIVLDPNHLDARSALMEFYWEAPGIVGGDKKKAYAMAQEIQRINPARGFLAYAELAAREKDQAKMADFYLKAVEANPRDYNAQLTLASYYGSDGQKKYDLAENHAREGLKLDPGRASAYSILAILFALRERWADLDAIIGQAEKNVPDNFNPYYQAGRILLNTGKDLPRAERYFRKYLTQEPEGNSPHWAAAHWRLGLVFEKQGRKPEAIAEIEAAAKLEPNFEPAKKDLKRLK